MPHEERIKADLGDSWGWGAVMREWPLFPASLEGSGVLANHW